MCNYRRGSNRFQVGHGFTNELDCLLKIKVLIEDFLSLQEHEIEGRNISQNFEWCFELENISYDSKDFPSNDLQNAI